MFKKEPDLPLAFAQQEKKEKKKIYEYIFPSHKIYPIGIGTSDTIILLILLFIGILTRIYRIQFPMEIIFNEDRIGQEINRYHSGLFFQDYQNSPFISLFYYYISTLFDYDGNFSYQISTSFCNSSSNCDHIQFKTISAILSGFCPLLIYLTVRIMLTLASTASTPFTIRLSSLTAAILATFETSFISRERFMFIDGFLHHCFCASLLFIYLDNYYFMWHTLLGKCFYISLSVAISPSRSFGLVIAAVVREFLFFRPNIIFRMNNALVRSLVIIVSVVVLQYIVFWTHLNLLPFESQGKIPNFLNETLIDKKHPNFMLRYEKTSLSKLFVQCTYLIFHRNDFELDLKFESRFWNWPFGNFLKGILYIDNYDHKLNISSATHHYYACIPNIFIYLFVFLSVFSGFFLIFRFSKKCQKFKYFIDFIFLHVGYFASFLPFLFDKHTFIYNYSSSLIFGIVFSSNLIEKLINPKYKSFIYTFIIVLAFAGYLMFCPYVYGLRSSYSSYFFQ